MHEHRKSTRRTPGEKLTPGIRFSLGEEKNPQVKNALQFQQKPTRPISVTILPHSQKAGLSSQNRLFRPSPSPAPEMAQTITLETPPQKNPRTISHLVEVFPRRIMRFGGEGQYKRVLHLLQRRNLPLEGPMLRGQRLSNRGNSSRET